MRRYLVGAGALLLVCMLVATGSYALLIVQPKGELGDRVFFDEDRNGVESEWDWGIGGVTVTLTGTTTANVSVSKTMETNADGYYKFTGLAAGTYKVTISGVDASYYQVYEWAEDLDGEMDGDTSTFLPAGASNMNLDFGFCADLPEKGWATFTQGGWGSKPKDNGWNPGTILHTYWDDVIGGSLVVGGGYTLTLTCAQAVTDLLPTGGTCAPLEESLVDPSKRDVTVLAGQVVALTLNVKFAGSVEGMAAGLGALKITRGEFAGYSVYELLSVANAVLGGDSSALPAGVTISALNDACTNINENYCDGADKGFLELP